MPPSSTRQASPLRRAVRALAVAAVPGLSFQPPVALAGGHVAAFPDKFAD